MAHGLLTGFVMRHPTEAVVLAAGMGTRLGHRTACRPKPLLQVNGVSIVANALTHLADMGITRTTVVIGHLGDQIKDGIGDAARTMEVRYEVNEEYRTSGTARSLQFGLRHVRADVVVLEGDVFFDRSTIEHFFDQPHRDATLLERWNTTLDGSVVELRHDDTVIRWLHKSRRPASMCLSGTYKTVNMHRFSSEFVRERLRPALASPASNSEPLEDTFDRVVGCGATIHGLEARGRWVEVDDEADLRQARAVFIGGANGSR